VPDGVQSVRINRVQTPVKDNFWMYVGEAPGSPLTQIGRRLTISEIASGRRADTNSQVAAVKSA